jgi:predicted AlkP superfamily pyrophosphatase or phosphodiesterase
MPSFVPQQAKQLLTAGYYRYQSWQADRSHEPAEGGEERQADGAPDHVIVVVLDALRPDFEPDLPVEFGRAVTPGTWTFPAVTSLHTGTYPHEHEAVAHTHPDDDVYVIPEQAAPERTLPEVFESAEFDTYAGLAFMTPFLAVQGWYGSHRVYRDVRAERVLNGYRKWQRGRDNTPRLPALGRPPRPDRAPGSVRRGTRGGYIAGRTSGPHQIHRRLRRVVRVSILP